MLHWFLFAFSLRTLLSNNIVMRAHIILSRDVSFYQITYLEIFLALFLLLVIHFQYAWFGVMHDFTIKESGKDHNLVCLFLICFFLISHFIWWWGALIQFHLHSSCNYNLIFWLVFSSFSYNVWQVSVGYFLSDLGMICWLYPSLGGLEYVSTYFFICGLSSLVRSHVWTGRNTN